MKPLFTLGHLVATPGALAAIGVSGDDLSTYLAGHQSADWGDIDAHDRRENQLSFEAYLHGLLPSEDNVPAMAAASSGSSRRCWTSASIARLRLATRSCRVG